VAVQALAVAQALVAGALAVREQVAPGVVVALVAAQEQVGLETAVVRPLQERGPVSQVQGRGFPQAAMSGSQENGRLHFWRARWGPQVPNLA